MGKIKMQPAEEVAQEEARYSEPAGSATAIPIAETDDAGALTVAFDSEHGWFWRNRSKVRVDLTLNVRGAYSEVKHVL